MSDANKWVGFFPGQGSQQIGMGKALYEEFGIFRQTFEEAEEAIRINLKKICFDGPESDLALTENTQPAIVTVSVGCARVLKQITGIEPDVVLGHSLGEYAALVVAGALPFQTAVRWVRERGIAMQKAVPVGAGAMAAVLGAEDAQVIEWCQAATSAAKQARASATDQSFETDCTVEPANFNAPGQVVVSGSADGVTALEKLVQEKGIRGVMLKRLNVSAPFHCSLMKPARDRMDEIFAKESAQLKTPEKPYIPNRTARLTREPGVILNLLSEQVDHSVLWTQSVETLIASGYTRAIEFGPGKVLQGLAKRITKGKAEFPVEPLSDIETLKLLEAKK